jgi:LytS/YehU family sensor histidine kinase
METSGKITAKPKNIKEFLRSRYFWKPFLGILTGGTAGFLYYHFIGCSTGSCFITSHSYSSIIFGGLAGYLIAA